MSIKYVMLKYIYKLEYIFLVRVIKTRVELDWYICFSVCPFIQYTMHAVYMNMELCTLFQLNYIILYISVLVFCLC